MHATDNMEDGYFGSGKRIRYSIKKHGKQNHTKEVLEFFETREELRNRERELINETVLLDPRCMNLQLGGEGGFCSKEHQLKCSSAGGRTTNPEKSRKASEKMKETNRKMLASGKWHSLNWRGRKHREETKKKMSDSRKGKGFGSENSQFGTKWITNGQANKKLAANSTIPDGWITGRTMNK